MRPTHRTTRDRRRGASLVETAFVLPIFILLVIGLIEFARVVMFQQVLTDAARIGCRQASLATTLDATRVNNTIRTNLRSLLAKQADADYCRISVAPVDFAAIASGTTITTTVEVNFADVTWIPCRWLGNVVLRGSASMKRE